MRRFWILPALCALIFLLKSSAQTATSQLLAEPSVAPDGSTIAFASGGDIWLTPLRGGQAHRLVAGSFDESRPMFSPDGTKVAFVSTRTGGGDVYVQQLATGALLRITFTEGPELLDGWSRDGKWLYYSMISGDIARMADIYRVRSEGGTPVPAIAERYVSEYFSAPSPVDDQIAFTLHGENFDRW